MSTLVRVYVTQEVGEHMTAGYLTEDGELSRDDEDAEIIELDAVSKVLAACTYGETRLVDACIFVVSEDEDEDEDA